MRGAGLGWIVGLLFGLSFLTQAAEKTPTNFKANYLELEGLTQTLTDQGLEILGTHAVAGESDYTVVIYTSPELKKAAQRPGRGFIATLRVLHNKKDQELVVANPEYYMRAFLQKEYAEGSAQPIQDTLEKALGALTPTEDSLKTKKLANYNFMLGMPHYDNGTVVATGPTSELFQALEKNVQDRLVFSVDLNGDGSSILCGVSLPVDIEQFNQMLETMGQAHLLPYPVLIENEKATILPAKYYLALNFPRLTMGEFMKIMSVPREISNSFKTDFR